MTSVSPSNPQSATKMSTRSCCTSIRRGGVLGIADLADAIFDARNHKPTVAQIDGIGASAAYHPATQASKIYAGRMDMVGSIGTRMHLYDFSVAFKKDGITPVVIDTGGSSRSEHWEPKSPTNTKRTSRASSIDTKLTFSR